VLTYDRIAIGCCMTIVCRATGRDGLVKAVRKPCVIEAILAQKYTGRWWKTQRTDGRDRRAAYRPASTHGADKGLKPLVVSQRLA
jgi:hypothetical protein